ncbi:MAG TPA: L,D-transpeptidase/peptidoglycan binding protein [Solirubrobacter sp.]|nr:L,D-transpeptidase/peptidoglycan binding protein [Solirubrobacter sp.]
MRRCLLVTIALFIALVPAAGAQDARIPASVSAGGTDVSGLTLAEAEAKLAAVNAPLVDRPITIAVAGRTFTLTPSQDVNFAFDARKSARRAYNAGIKPHTTPVNVELYVTYSSKKLNAALRSIRDKVSRKARDARVAISLSRIRRAPHRDGRTIDTKALYGQVRAALRDQAAPRALAPALKAVKPKVTTAAITRQYGTVITIDRGNFKLRLFKNLKLSKTYRVAVGQPGYPTPTGRFSIANKAVNPAWTAPNRPWAGAYANETVPGGSAENPLKARWLGIVDGVGIHGTGIPGSIGTRASHGCIRMTVPDVIDLYPRVPVGTPVLIGN